MKTKIMVLAGIMAWSVLMGGSISPARAEHWSTILPDGKKIDCTVSDYPERGVWSDFKVNYSCNGGNAKFVYKCGFSWLGGPYSCELVSDSTPISCGDKRFLTVVARSLFVSVPPGDGNAQKTACQNLYENGAVRINGFY